MEVVLDQNDAAEWTYRGEGAVNLVLAYSGSSPAFIGKVLRIQKAARNESEGTKSRTALTEHERLLWKETEELVSSPTREIAGHMFVQHVIGPLLGSDYVDAGTRITVSREFLESVEKNVLCQRPAWRVDAAKVDSQSDSVLLLTDHSTFPRGIHEGEPCLCVEIKSKCGFLPISEFIDEGNSIKRSVSRYRMHQALKLHDGEVSSFSEYDPLDLFSGLKDRIHKSIKDLFFTPQNNFRVFLDGSLIFGALGAAAGSTNFVIQEAFEDALKDVIQGDYGLRSESFLQLIADTIYVSGIMDRLIEVQKLDNLDIEGAIHAYYNIVSEPCTVCRELGEEKVSHSYASLHSISLDESLKIVKNFLIATTAKDCSFMMCFRLRKEGISGSSYSSVYLKSTNQTFDYKVCFIDLDLKPLKKMQEYYEKDKNIVSCYTKKVEAEQEADKTTSLEVYGNVF
ncbi:Inositol-pentakisphosphate 2-kinase [Parasponia andersonii]|uniref:Inositol-pentakisphosphate 2-kinase n=1 Tax=Parasponia andersonii TaxID=3476 RepID=A0A2P5C1N1_PARAD|nr:Inositol-pentakisphosphate 2-kinase [Parasponia andersonii]